MRLLLLLLPALLLAQPAMQTELRNGVLRAVVLHSSGAPVTDDEPAQPLETLILQGAGFSVSPQLFVAGAPSDSTAIDDATLQFTLPADAGGGFLQLAIAEGNAASIPVDAAVDGVQLSAAEVQTLVLNAAAADGPGLAIAVVDRAGNVLALYRRPATSDAEVERALSLARTGAFFSNQSTPLSSRTVRSISRINFPEGIPNTPAGDLFGIENTNRGCSFNVPYLAGQAYPRYLDAGGAALGGGIATVPGGVPLFRDGVTVVGGIGVSGLDNYNLGANNYQAIAIPSLNEAAAVSAAQSAGFFVRVPLPDPGAVYIAGFRLPFVNPAPIHPAASPGGSFQIAPRNGSPAPEGWLVGPLSSATLTQADVAAIVQNAVNTANRTRAAIRLPAGSRTRMVISVADLDGNILAIYRMPDATIFSIDVALTKARNVVYFSGVDRDPRDLPGVPLGTAITNRTVGFASQRYFPSGISNTQPGPFAELYAFDLANPCTQGHQPANLNQSGVVFFPGSAPLYRDGRLVGGLGVSGDGVDQDDYVTAGGAVGYEAPASLRADQLFLRNVRLPYWKFPRNPEQ